MSAGYWSREARLARLGTEVYELGLAEADAAPAPTPAQVALVARVFAPHLKRVADVRASASSRAA